MSADLAGLEAPLAGLAGLLVGSFLNVCIHRLPRDLSVVRPRSQCPGCGKLIRSWDNIPIFSFLLLRAKCRDCGTPISWRYPLVEILTGLLFFAFIARQGLSPMALRNCIFSAGLLILIFTDLETRILPEHLTIGGIFAGLVLASLVPVRDGTAALIFMTARERNEFLMTRSLPWETVRIESLMDALIGAIVPAGALWLTGWIFEKVRHKEGLGLGDVVLIAAIGSFLGLRGTLLTLFLGALVGSVTGLLYIRLKREDPSSYHLPLGSFLGAAAIATALFGDSIARIYARWSEALAR